MRTTQENEKIHELATALLKRRGVQPNAATFEQYADAAEIAAEAVERKGPGVTLAEMLAVGAIGDGTPDKRTAGVLAKFAKDGKFIADRSIDEQEFLEAAIAAEAQEDEATFTGAARGGFLAEADAPCPHGYPGGKADGCPYCK